MANKNYSKISKKSKETKNEELTPEIIEKVVVEETKIEAPVENVVEVKTTTGVILGCVKLNLREEANINSKVLAILNENTELVISLEESTEDFYKVVTATGVEGYCMKKFITIK